MKTVQLGCQNCAGRLYRGEGETQIDGLLCRECQKSPAKQVRVLMARRRENGTPFDEAWLDVVGRVVVEPDGTIDLVGGRVRWPHDTTHRKEWKAILADKDGVEVWRRAYERRAVERGDAPLVQLMTAA